MQRPWWLLMLDRRACDTGAEEEEGAAEASNEADSQGRR